MTRCGARHTGSAATRPPGRTSARRRQNIPCGTCTRRSTRVGLCRSRSRRTDGFDTRSLSRTVTPSPENPVLHVHECVDAPVDLQVAFASCTDGLDHVESGVFAFTSLHVTPRRRRTRSCTCTYVDAPVRFLQVAFASHGWSRHVESGVFAFTFSHVTPSPENPVLHARMCNDAPNCLQVAFASHGDGTHGLLCFAGAATAPGNAAPTIAMNNGHDRRPHSASSLLPPRDLRIRTVNKVDKDPTWRHEAIYTRDEVEALISDEADPLRSSAAARRHQPRGHQERRPAPDAGAPDAREGARRVEALRLGRDDGSPAEARRADRPDPERHDPRRDRGAAAVDLRTC